MTYSIDYSGQTPEQRNIGGGEYVPPAIRYEAPRRGFVVPSIVKTTAAFLLGGAVLFGMEAAGPVQFRPSTLMGTYDARVEEQVKAAELRVQGRYEAWAVQNKTAAEQSVERYKMRMQGVLTAYQAGVERAKLYAQLTGQLQSQRTGAQLSRVGAEQAGDVNLISLGRMLGTIANGVQPGAGDGLTTWAQDRSAQLGRELDNAVTNGQPVTIDGWDTGLPSVADLQRQLDTVEPMKVPPMPSLGPDTTSGR